MIKIIDYRDFDASAFRDNQSAAHSVTDTVSQIIADVRARGDAALLDYCEKLDGCRLTSVEVTREEIDAAMSAAGDKLLAVMRRAAANIEAFHRRQIREGFVITTPDGVTLGQRILPIERAGLYIPGGTAAYPSSVLMNCIPARLAGVPEIIMTTPPKRDGSVDPGILAAASIAGVNRIFKLGGAQAVAAMAYGTGSVPRADKIVGPGNAYVAEAKRQVFGIVGIDMIAGPSDILVIADERADARHVAADMLSQCEHGETSRAVLVTDSATLAEAVRAEIETQLAALPRGEMAREAAHSNSAVIVTDTLERAFDIANELAPEHLEIFLDEPLQYLGLVKNAGSVFLGKHTPEAVGDYWAGVNHTLPTSGTARFSGPLSVDDFVKKSSFTYYSRAALEAASGDIALFAEREGLDAHARSVTIRL